MMKILNRWILVLSLACIANVTNAQTNKSNDPEGSSDGYVNYDTEYSEDIQSIGKSRSLEHKSSTAQRGRSFDELSESEKIKEISREIENFRQSAINDYKSMPSRVENELESMSGKMTDVNTGTDYGASKYDKKIFTQSDLDHMEENRAAGFERVEQLIIFCSFFVPIILIGIWMFVEALKTKKRSDSFLDEKTFRNDNSRN